MFLKETKVPALDQATFRYKQEMFLEKDSFQVINQNFFKNKREMFLEKYNFQTIKQKLIKDARALVVEAYRELCDALAGQLYRFYYLIASIQTIPMSVFSRVFSLKPIYEDFSLNYSTSGENISTFKINDANIISYDEAIKRNRKLYEEFYIESAERLLRTRRVLVLPAFTNISIITNSYDVVHS
jgi:hypothetical protein